MQLGRLGGVLRAVGEPGLGGGDIGADQQPVLIAPRAVPFLRALQQSRVLAQPGEVGFERAAQGRQPGHERAALVEAHVVQRGQRLGDRDVAHGLGEYGEDALRLAARLFDLPAADGRGGRLRRQHEHDRVGGQDQGAKAVLPGLALLDRVAVDHHIEPAVELEPADELVGKRGIGARIRDEDLEFFRRGVDGF